MSPCVITLTGPLPAITGDLAINGGAGAIIDGDARDPAKRKIAHEFLESNTAQVWINKQLEGR